MNITGESHAIESKQRKAPLDTSSGDPQSCILAGIISVLWDLFQ